VQHMVVSAHNGCILSWQAYTSAACKHDIIYEPFVWVLSLWTLCSKFTLWV